MSDNNLESLFEDNLGRHKIGDLAVRYVGSTYLLYNFGTLLREGPKRATALDRVSVRTDNPVETLKGYLREHHPRVELQTMGAIDERPGNHAWFLVDLNQ